MKLIIREYLKTLNERDELDVLVPNLLSQIGLTVFSKPGRGNKQYGVDVAAYGKIGKEKPKVYLFSIKAGNLSNQDWNSGNKNDLRPSLDQIRDTYIRCHLPPKYKDKQIEICLCFGGDLQEDVRVDVTSYEDKYQEENITFSEWNGEVLSSLIEKHFLREQLLPNECQSLLRKSLAMIDIPESSQQYFSRLTHLLTNKEFKNDDECLKAVRQLYLCLSILISWSKSENNLESACLSSEQSLLILWDKIKKYYNIKKKNKKVSGILELFRFYWMLTLNINNTFLDTKILPHVNKYYGLSKAIKSICPIDINLKLFDILGRLALYGFWNSFIFTKLSLEERDGDFGQSLIQKLHYYRDAIILFISNNQILYSPCLDEQAIDISLAVLFLVSLPDTKQFIHTWLSGMTKSIGFQLGQHLIYPCIFKDYEKLIRHPKNMSDEYRKEATASSILYPYIALFASLFDLKDVYKDIQDIKNLIIQHCNFQLWYPDSTSEDLFYTNEDLHGSSLSSLNIKQDPEQFLADVLNVCDSEPYYKELSAIKYGINPIILTACRHYRLPIPIDYFKFLTKTETN